MHTVTSPHQPTAARCAFVRHLEGRWAAGHFVCVGLDPDYDRLPLAVRHGRSRAEAFVAFNRAIVDATAEFACAFKPNAAFYEAEGLDGARALAETVAYIKAAYPAIPVIYDAKRGDIGNTNRGYTRAAFDVLGADALTIHGYFGQEAAQPFLDRADRGIIVMASNSNPGAGEFQDLPVGESCAPLYQVVARNVATRWNTHGNCALAVGAPYPEKIAAVRRVAPDLPLLILGIGAQGAPVAPAIAAAQDRRGQGMIVSSSRAILYASSGDDYAEAAHRAAAALAAAIARHR